MYAVERHQTIVERCRRDGRVEVGSLADDLQVTPETIRRDLSELERRRLLRRVHGGAVPVERLLFEPGVPERAASRAAEKARIAAAALSEVPDEGVILLDAGTTTGALADALPVDRELTVVTNDLPIAVGLSAKPNITVWTLGGRVRARTLSQVETWAMRALEEVVVDVAFMATNGITVDDGLTTPDQSESAVKRAMIRAARRSVLLADHTKVGRSFFARFATLEQIDKLITDSGLDEVAARRLRDAGLEVVAA